MTLVKGRVRGLLNSVTISTCWHEGMVDENGVGMVGNYGVEWFVHASLLDEF